MSANLSPSSLTTPSQISSQDAAAKQLKVNQDLLEAAKKGDLEGVTRLIEQEGAQIRYKREHNAFQLAIQNSHLKVMQYLLKKDSELLHIANNIQCLPLQIAISNNANSTIIEFLIKELQQSPAAQQKKAFIQALDSAIYSDRSDNLSIINRIIQVAGLDLILEKDLHSQYNAIDAAIAYKKPIILKLLLTKIKQNDVLIEKFKFQFLNQTAFGDVLEDADANIIKILLRFGLCLTRKIIIDSNKKFGIEPTSFPKMEKAKLLNAADLLLTMAGKVVISKSDNSDSKKANELETKLTAEDTATLTNVERELNNALEVLGTAVNACDKPGNTALHLATQVRNKRLVSKLLCSGATVELRNYAQVTALQIAESLKTLVGQEVLATYILSIFNAHQIISKIQAMILELETQETKLKLELQNTNNEDELTKYLNQAMLAIDCLANGERVDACLRLGMMLGRPLAPGFYPKISAKLLKQVINSPIAEPKQSMLAGKCLFELTSGGHLVVDKSKKVQGLDEEEETTEEQTQETALTLEALLKMESHAFQEKILGNLTASYVFGSEYGIHGLGEIRNTFGLLTGIRNLHQKKSEQAQAELQTIRSQAAAREHDLLQKISALQLSLSQTQAENETLRNASSAHQIPQMLTQFSLSSAATQPSIPPSTSTQTPEPKPSPEKSTKP